MTEVINTEVQATETAAPIAAPEAVVEKAWYESLPEEFKYNKNITNFKSVEDLVKSYANQTSLLGKKVSDWSAEDINRFAEIKGRPSNASDYIFADEMDAALKESFAAKAFEAGLTQEQAKILADKMVLENRAAIELEEKNIAQLKSTWAEELKTEFGAAHDQRIELARRSFNSLADEGLKQLLESTGLHEHPSMIKLFSKIGKEFLEADRVVRSEADSRFGVSPAEAQAKINAKLADAEFRKAYLNALHPKHKDAVSEMTNLYSLTGK